MPTPSPVVLVARRFATYDDVPGQRYHFPRSRYESLLRAAERQIALVYEPRRGGVSATSIGGGRQAFIAWAILGAVEPDRSLPDHGYVRFLEYQELAQPVPLSAVRLSGKALQWAVLRVDATFVEAVLRHGMSPLLAASPDTVGFVDRMVPSELTERPLRDVVREEVVRDRTFRFKVIEQAYEGRCAMTDLRLTNGYGRAEVDAAHIQPVSEGGPDVVSNGLALTKTLHWAFDRGLVSATDNGRMLVVERGLPDGLRRLLRRDMSLARPSSPAFAPHPAFLSWHRAQVFKGDAMSFDNRV